MDYLLRYALFKAAVWILAIEVIFLACITAAIILIKWGAKQRKQKNDALLKSLTDYLTKSYLAGAYQPLPRNLNSYSHLIQAMEDFDKRIQDPKWDNIKETILQKHLLLKANSNVSSSFWKRRQLAARVFFLAPKFAAEQDLLALLHDSKYLVRVVAASIITKVGSKPLFFAMVDQMASEPTLSRYAYRDALLQMGSDRLTWLKELLETNSNPKIQSICLDIFGTRTLSNLFSTILPYIYSDNKTLKLLAIKILKSIPSQQANDVLIHCLNDHDWEIRQEALQSMNPELAGKEIEKIQEMLKDPEWYVRLQAALALRKLGETGEQRLYRQTPHQSSVAHEISQYVLALPTAH
jgi:hypothetical protein